VSAAEKIARALGGRKAGAGWMARCPAHDDREPSLSIREAEGGRVLVRCHAGCGQGQVIAALKPRQLWLEIIDAVATIPSTPKQQLWPFGNLRRRRVARSCQEMKNNNVVAFGNERISAMRTEITLIGGPNPAMSKRISLDEQGKVCSDGSQC
jgi:hypothetical protein